jgi:hypothetical protein
MGADGLVTLVVGEVVPLVAGEVVVLGAVEVVLLGAVEVVPLGAVGVVPLVAVVIVVTAVAVEPSEKVAVRVSVRPGRNSMPCESDANATKLPPSATGKFTAIVDGAFSKAPPAVGATPSTQNSVPLSVSQVPGPSLARRTPVTVRPPLACTVTVMTPSSTPSGPAAALDCPTASLSMPL